MDPKSKWNRKYNDRINQMDEPRPNNRLKKLSTYLNGGLALDLACGLGANSLWLGKLGYQVKAYDISDVAIDFVKEQAEKHQLSVEPRLCDITDWSNLNLKNNSFELVVMTYYLDRLIFPNVKSIIKENGYFFMETFYHSRWNENKAVSDKYKLRSQELLAMFGDWRVLYYEENKQEGWQTIFCQKCSSK